MLRRILALLAGVLAVVFFASVACPPVSERDRPPRETVGIPDTRPGAVERAEATRREREQAQTVEVLVQVLDELGAPIAGAQVRLERLAGMEAEFLLTRTTDARGELRFPWPGPVDGRLRLHAGSADHLPAQPVDCAAEAPTEPVVFTLARGARLHGRVEGVDGTPVLSGEILLLGPDGAEAIVKPGPGGVFTSPPLAAGTWHATWREHGFAELDPRLRESAQLAPGARHGVLMTVPIPGREVRDGRRIGVAPLQD